MLPLPRGALGGSSGCHTGVTDPFHTPAAILTYIIAGSILSGNDLITCHPRRNSLAGAAHKSARERVATFLLDMAKRLAKDTIQLLMSRQDIADYLGLTIETVSRCLSQLAEARVIELTGSRRITLRNRPVLSELGKQSSSDNGFLDPLILQQSRIYPTAALRAAGGLA